VDCTNWRCGFSHVLNVEDAAAIHSIRPILASRMYRHSIQRQISQDSRLVRRKLSHIIVALLGSDRCSFFRHLRPSPQLPPATSTCGEKVSNGKLTRAHHLSSIIGWFCSHAGSSTDNLSLTIKASVCQHPK
jgi:hypothetical protein